MLGLVIVDDKTGVHDAGNPAGKGQEQAQDKTEQATRHQNRHWRKDDTEEVTQGFQEK